MTACLKKIAGNYKITEHDSSSSVTAKKESAVLECNDEAEEEALKVFGSSGRRYQRGGRGRRNHHGLRQMEDRRQGRQTNRPGWDGRPSRCAVCGSIFHWASRCPDKHPKQKEEEDSEVHIVLMAHEQGELVTDTFGVAILDTGCTKTVCGEKWLDCYLDGLEEADRQLMEETTSESYFRFGDGERQKSLKNVQLSCRISSKSVHFNGRSRS